MNLRFIIVSHKLLLYLRTVHMIRQLKTDRLSSENQYTLILICPNLTNIFSHLFLFLHLSLAHLVLQRQGVLEDKNNKRIWNMMKTRNGEQHKPKTIRSNCAQTVLSQPSRSCQKKPASAWRFNFSV